MLLVSTRLNNEYNLYDLFICYRLGVALRQQQCEEEAIEVLIRSLTCYPLNWSAWLELGKCFDTFDKVNILVLLLLLFVMFNQ